MISQRYLLLPLDGEISNKRRHLKSRRVPWWPPSSWSCANVLCFLGTQQFQAIMLSAAQPSRSAAATRSALIPACSTAMLASFWPSWVKLSLPACCGRAWNAGAEHLLVLNTCLGCEGVEDTVPSPQQPETGTRQVGSAASGCCWLQPGAWLSWLWMETVKSREGKGKDGAGTQGRAT